MWTEFMDMSSGGSEKTKWGCIYINLPVNKAIEYFKDKFGIDPDHITCDCCGEDFWIEEVDEPKQKGDSVLVISDMEKEQKEK